uniref:Uncharacterized protein n=1 Tax=Globodera rostochiensis TaxID=31243 RepID=A0A914IBN5_GLORO
MDERSAACHNFIVISAQQNKKLSIFVEVLVRVVVVMDVDECGNFLCCQVHPSLFAVQIGTFWRFISSAGNLALVCRSNWHILAFHLIGGQSGISLPFKLAHFGVLSHRREQSNDDSLCRISESSVLYEKFCAVLDDAHRVRNGKEWLKLRENNKQPPTEDKNGAFAEWSYRYYSIERFFDYCYFLKKSKVCEFSIELVQKKRPFVCKCKKICAPYENTKFQHIALKPEFKYERGDPMSIGDAMRKIVEAYQKLYPGNLQKLQSLISRQKELPKMDFCNKEDCIKVHAWVYYAKNGGDSDVATPKLEQIQKHLLKNVPLNLKEFPPQPPQNEKQTAEKPKIKLPQNYSTSSSSSPRGHYQPNKTVLVTLEHPVQATTVVVLEVAMVEVVMGSIVILVVWIVLPVRGRTSSFAASCVRASGVGINANCSLSASVMFSTLRWQVYQPEHLAPSLPAY